jgi:hypothetical protein
MCTTSPYVLMVKKHITQIIITLLVGLTKHPRISCSYAPFELVEFSVQSGKQGTGTLNLVQNWLRLKKKTCKKVH